MLATKLDSSLRKAGRHDCLGVHTGYETSNLCGSVASNGVSNVGGRRRASTHLLTATVRKTLV